MTKKELLERNEVLTNYLKTAVIKLREAHEQLKDTRLTISDDVLFSDAGTDEKVLIMTSISELFDIDLANIGEVMYNLTIAIDEPCELHATVENK